jgi:signal transduction histidine kinase
MQGKILIVDDEAGPRESMRMILKRSYHVRTAAGGEEALREIECDLPDLVFLDLRMPGMHGTELLQAIKETHPEVQVAVITAYAGVDSARLAIRCGAVDYLTKPYSVADVERIAEKALCLRRQQHDAEVLAAQLAKMTETLVARATGLQDGARTPVADAVQQLRTVQSELGEGIETVGTLSELGEVAAEVTHDINNLLTVILTNSQYLLMQIDGRPDGELEAITKRVSRIVRATEDCSAMIRRIKDFVHVNVSFRPSLIDANELVNSVVDLKREALSSTGKPVEFRLGLRSVVPVYGDEVALRTVLVNMIENSLDALDEGCIEVETDFHGGFVQIRVRDNGCGMPPAVLQKATDAFFTANKPQGTGLGLSTADRVVKRHGGRLQIESEEGVGTTVTVELPVRAGTPSGWPDPAPKVEASSPPAAPELVPASPAKRRGTVVLVDDEEGIRELIASVLEMDGYEVVQAGDGRDGWEAFQLAYESVRPGPLMVVTDQEMPRMTGRQLATRVKESAPQVPVLLVSGYVVSDGPAVEDAMLSKPFGIEELIASVRGLADAGGVQRGPALCV